MLEIFDFEKIKSIQRTLKLREGNPKEGKRREGARLGHPSPKGVSQG
jgi:hypothetical protein